MLNVIVQYGRDFDVKFSNEKNQVVVVNAEDIDKGRMWALGEMDICRTNSYKYLGIIVD